MVLESRQTTVAYRCPQCGAGVMSVVGLFNLNADMVKLKCDCGESAMTLVYSNDKDSPKVRISVPCVLCPNPHIYTVSSSIFFKDDLFLLPCPYSDINIAVTGETNKVKAELARSELELLELLPTQTKRTEEMDKFQQFSTPPSIAYLANYTANVNKNDIMLEPSAGIGGIAVFAKKDGATVYVNELDNRRLEVLKNL